MADRTPTELLDAWFDAIPTFEPARLAELVHEDGALEAPFAPPGVPRRTEGREAIGELMGMLGRMFTDFRWTARDVHTTDDPEVAVATAAASITLVNGEPYEQEFVYFVRAREGLIAEVTEYMDPLRAQAALATLAA